eukprot:TRINITY_DN5276_c3_g1_i1.p1 TRINITY_DN5276_c3_g1~~TRINITY_DN5276_c3_g1_i1.p1  ORF type:complete len:146 (+),score=26.84 TRINITY_DN5276_c3_g1_i1:60-497(+)
MPPRKKQKSAKEREKSEEKEETEEEEEENNNEELCQTCKKVVAKNWDGTWWECNKCAGWHHTVCSGLRSSEIKRLQKQCDIAEADGSPAPVWNCPACTKTTKTKSGRKSTSKRDDHKVTEPKPWKWTVEEEEDMKHAFEVFLDSR